MNELIVIEQLPIIKENLRTMSAEIDKAVTEALSLVCNESTVKSVKETRASLTKQFSALEEQRKAVKVAVMAPYDEFDKVYKECITDKFKTADADLKRKIEDVENGLKEEKSKEVIDYFFGYAGTKNIDFVSFESSGVQVTLSATTKKLKEQITEFLDKVSDELSLIDTQENKAEILVEYKKTLNVASAIRTVSERRAAIEAEKAKLPIPEPIKAEPTNKEIPQVPTTPTLNSNKLKISIEFNVSRSELFRLRAILNESGIEYKEGELMI